METLAGIVDLYVHSNPDLLERQKDDIGLARASAEAGLRAVVHRSHFACTSARARLAHKHGGCETVGALVLNDHVGGLNVSAADVALRTGARWIGMPTLSSRRFRGIMARNAVANPMVGLGPGELELLGRNGEVLPVVREILTLAAASGAAVGLGYGDYNECLAVAKAGREAGVASLVLTYPDLMGLNDREIDAILEIPGVMLEICAFTLHPCGMLGDASEDLRRRALGWLARIGVERCIASSDGGMSGYPGPLELLEWMVTWLRQNGATDTHIDRMMRRNPARVLNIDVS